MLGLILSFSIPKPILLTFAFVGFLNFNFDLLTELDN